MSTFFQQRWTFSEQLRKVASGSQEWVTILAAYRQHILGCPQCLERVAQIANSSTPHPELEESQDAQ